MNPQTAFARFVCLALLALPFSAQAKANAAEAGDWANALKPAGSTAPPLAVVADGAPRYAILLPVTPAAPERKAAADLQEWVKEITGAALPIATEDKRPDGVSRFISVGNTELLKQTAGVGNGEDLADEGYQIAVSGEHLLLRGGRTRGIVNAVYALLEEDLGCRWYTRAGDAKLPPKSNSLTLTVVPRSYVPRLKLRDPHYFAAFEPVWSLRNRTNAPNAAVPEDAGGHVDYAAYFVHTHAMLLDQGEIANHPEYFAQDAGGKRYAAQLCATNPDVARVVAENALNFLAKSPHAEIISISKNDNAGDQICHCPTCAKLRKDEGGSDAANQLVLVNKVAEAVEAKYPRVTIDTLAYLETSRVPRTIRPRPNVAVRFCNDAGGAWSYPFRTARELKTAELAKAWSAVHDRIYVWDYSANFSHYLAPMPNFDVVADNLRFWVENRAEGVLMQGAYQGVGERDEMRAWVFAKLMWDPSRDVQALTRDFIRGYYGKAAGPIEEYDALLNGLRTEHKDYFAGAMGIRYDMNAPFLSKSFLNRATQLFADAAKLAEGDERLLHRVERAELPILYVKLCQGPSVIGQEMGRCLDRFEKIARREKLAYLAEGGSDFEAKLAAFRQQVPKPAP